MNTRTFTSLLLVLGFAWQLPAGAAEVMDEVEPNNPFESAQDVNAKLPGALLIQAIFPPDVHPKLPQYSKDLDFFQFSAQSGDVVTVGMSDANVDTFVALFREGDPETPLVWDVSDGDHPLIEGWTPVESGTYVIGVGPKTRNKFWDAALAKQYGASGTYTLSLERKAGTIEVPISIKPGSFHAENGKGTKTGGGKLTATAFGDEASGKSNGRGVIPVAILSTDKFNALEVDRESLTFGKTGEERSLRHCNKQGVHADGNARPDLVCFFEASKTNLTAEDKKGWMSGSTKDKKRIRGWDMLRPDIEE